MLGSASAAGRSVWATVSSVMVPACVSAKRRIVGDRAEDQARQIRAFTPPILVALQHDAVIRHPFDELVGAGAHGAAGRRAVHIALLHDGGRALYAEDKAQGQLGKQHARRLGEHQLDCVIVDDVDFLDRRVRAELGIVVLEGAPKAPLVVRVAPAIDVPLDGLGVERRAVMEGHALAQVEDPGLAIFGFPRFGQPRDRLGADAFLANQRLGDLLDDHGRFAVGDRAGVEQHGAPRRR